MPQFTLQSTLKLNNGINIPILGLGVWQAAEGEEVEDAVRIALAAGYRLIDTAKIYGNEMGVGTAIKAASVAREDLFVTTKLWNEDQGYDSALQAIDTSLTELQLSYVDLYLVHWPNSDRAVREETWRAMEAIFNSGKAKAIGVSNYTVAHLQEMDNYATIPPSVNQVEMHPFVYDESLLAACTERNIVPEAYSPLSRGERLMDSRITEVAATYGKTNAQILIRWGLQHNMVVIPKSVREERILENMDVFDFNLSAEDMATLDGLAEGSRYE